MKKIINTKYIKIVSWLLILFIIMALAKIYPLFAQSARNIQKSYNMYRIVYVIGTVIIGLLLEVDRIISGIVSGFEMMWLGVIISVGIIIMLMIPFLIGVSITGLGMTYTIMQEGLFRSIIGVSSGVILAQSITNRVEI